MHPQRIAELRNIVWHVPENYRSAVAKILEEPLDEIERLQQEIERLLTENAKLSALMTPAALAVAAVKLIEMEAGPAGATYSTLVRDTGR